MKTICEPVLAQMPQRHWEYEETLTAKQICCITNSNKQNIADRTYCISYKDISAVIKDTAIIDYYSIPREMFIHHMSLYKTILEDFIKESTVVPVKFGTIAGNNEEVEDILMTGYPMFKKAIDAMHGKAQVIITAKWNSLDAVIKRIGARFGQRTDIKRFNSSFDSSGDFFGNPHGIIKLGNMSKMAIEEENSRALVCFVLTLCMLLYL
ncbi:MAG: GvpL/GvpF family gas vesicle protein [Deltaproteobacteria bacterium]|nr:GvpL/GvpF family gas vesicle protein [Deltaproteobacteria bacterium]